MEILIIAPYFSPYSGVASLRMTSLAKHLSMHHKVTVATFSLAYLNYSYPDYIKGRVLEDIDYIYFDPPIGRYKFLKYPSYKKNLLKILERDLKTNKYDIAILTCGPLEPQGIMKTLYKKYGLKYIIDFRDLDILDYYFPLSTHKEKVKHCIKDRILSVFEKQCIRYAAHIVVANPDHKGVLAREYGIDNAKITAILNGHDNEIEDPFPAVEGEGRLHQNDQIIIGYLGKMVEYDRDRTVMFLKAVDRLKKAHDITIYHVGSGSEEIEQIIARHDIDPSIYRSFGMMDYKDGIRMMEKASLFATVHVMPHSLGTKIYDYISMNKPVIVIAPNGIALTKFTAKFANAFICDNEEEIIRNVLNIFENNKICLDPDLNPAMYSRNYQNALYEQLIVDVCNLRLNQS